MQLELVDGAGHRWAGVDDDVVADVLDRTLGFLAEHLTGGPGSAEPAG